MGRGGGGAEGGWRGGGERKGEGKQPTYVSTETVFSEGQQLSAW